MAGVNYLAVVAAAGAAFLVGAVWYSLLFGKAYMKLRGMNPGAIADMKPAAGAIVGELVRYCVVAFVLAHFVARLGVVDWRGAVELGLWIWVGFQAALLLGAVIHEKMPWKLYAIHASDALVKTLIMTLILGVWR